MRIAEKDNKAMNQLFAQAVSTGCKTAGIVDEKSPMNDGDAFKDHKKYVDTVEEILADDKSEAFDPNDEKLD
jgi:hypothetical protein